MNMNKNPNYTEKIIWPKSSINIFDRRSNRKRIYIDYALYTITIYIVLILSIIYTYYHSI